MPEGEQSNPADLGDKPDESERVIDPAKAAAMARASKEFHDKAAEERHKAAILRDPANTSEEAVELQKTLTKYHLDYDGSMEAREKIATSLEEGAKSNENQAKYREVDASITHEVQDDVDRNFDYYSSSNGFDAIVMKAMECQYYFEFLDKKAETTPDDYREFQQARDKYKRALLKVRLVEKRINENRTDGTEVRHEFAGDSSYRRINLGID